MHCLLSTYYFAHNANLTKNNFGNIIEYINREQVK